MISKKIIIIVVILLIAAAVIYQVNRAYENKLDKMAMDYSYKYLLDLRDHRISDIKKTTLFEAEEDMYKIKILRTIDFAVLPDYLKLNNYSDNEIKRRLKIVNIKDRDTKLNKIKSNLKFHFPSYTGLDNKINIKNKNFQTVLFENGDRSVVILSYYHKGKMYFMPFYIFQDKVVYKEYDGYDINSLMFIDFLCSKTYYFSDKKSFDFNRYNYNYNYECMQYLDVVFIEWLDIKMYFQKLKYIIIEDSENRNNNITVKIE